MSETALVLAIRNCLALDPDVLAIRVHSGLVRVKRGWMHLAPAGTADVCGCVRAALEPPEYYVTGRFFALEVKDPGGKTAKDRAEKQAAFRDKVRAIGGFAAEVDSVDAAVAAIQRAKAGETK